MGHLPAAHHLVSFTTLTFKQDARIFSSSTTLRVNFNMPGERKVAQLSQSFSRHLNNIDGESKEYFWGCCLNAEKPEQQWNFDEEEEDTDFFEHVLFLRSAVLGKGAVEGERNIVELETKNFEGQIMKQPLISLTLGRNDMTMLDMNFSHETAATFRLVEGTGPVCLAAMHQTEFPVEEEDTEETEDDNGTDLEYTEDGDTATQDSEGTDGEGSGKKRKAGSMKKTSKRGKLDSASSAPTSTAEEDEEDEEMEEDEEEEESEDGSESEDIEESPSPKKKNKNDAKTKGIKGKAAKKPVKALKNGKA